MLLNTCLGKLSRVSHALPPWRFERWNFLVSLLGVRGWFAWHFRPFFQGLPNQTFHGNTWYFITENMHHPLNPYVFYRQQPFGTDLIWFPGLDFWTMQFLQILKINWGSTSKNLDPQQQLDVPSLKLKKTRLPLKIAGKGKLSPFLLGPAIFSGANVSFQGGYIICSIFPAKFRRRMPNHLSFREDGAVFSQKKSFGFRCFSFDPGRAHPSSLVWATCKPAWCFWGKAECCDVPRASCCLRRRRDLQTAMFCSNSEYLGLKFQINWYTPEK